MWRGVGWGLEISPLDMRMQPVRAEGAAGLRAGAQARAQLSARRRASKTGREMVAERRNKWQRRTVWGSGSRGGSRGIPRGGVRGVRALQQARQLLQPQLLADATGNFENQLPFRDSIQGFRLSKKGPFRLYARHSQKRPCKYGNRTWRFSTKRTIGGQIESLALGVER